MQNGDMDGVGLVEYPPKLLYPGERPTLEKYGFEKGVYVADVLEQLATLAETRHRGVRDFETSINEWTLRQAADTKTAITDIRSKLKWYAIASAGLGAAVAIGVEAIIR